MRKIVLGLAGLALLCGCEPEEKLCKEDSECAFVCEAYALNKVMYACHEGKCSCVAPEMMKCTGDEEKDHCAGICEMYRPGTVASCDKDGYCVCEEPKEPVT